jgi:hemolysin D
VTADRPIPRPSLDWREDAPHASPARRRAVIDGKPLELAPGMAVAEIKTGKRRVLDYLLSPLHRYGHDVLGER